MSSGKGGGTGTRSPVLALKGGSDVQPEVKERCCSCKYQFLAHSSIFSSTSMPVATVALG